MYIHFRADMRHTIEVTAPLETPTVGDTYTLTCTVQSDLPAMLTWLGPSPLNRPSISITHENLTRTSTGFSVQRSNITFDPVLPSHGGEYTCQSAIDNSSPRNNVSQTHPLTIERKIR